MMLRVMRRWHRMLFGIVIATVAFLLYTNYFSRQIYGKNKNQVINQQKKSLAQWEQIELQIPGRGQTIPSKECPSLDAVYTNISTVDQYSKFEFQPSWIQGQEFWDTNFEKRYLERQSRWSKLPLKVILMPHSHNDPGWLTTFEEYYFHQSSKILSNMIEKLEEHSDMTFIWTEVSFLSMWFERAHPSMRVKLRELVRSGRLEITSGGWVMPDEANTDVFAIVTQLIEGHQWLYNNLDVKPVNGWTIDTFGHGSAVPYLLKEAGLTGTVVQRLHYMWKQWLAEKEAGDFMWRQTWDSSGETDILTHNFPFDIYSIKHSCGPHPQICLNFDFRKVADEYTEHSLKAVTINDKNVKEKSKLLIEQYGRTGSLFPHNVVLIPIGNDFRYDHLAEWDQQYENYQRMLQWVNNHPSYHVQMQWGTLKDYFDEVRKRSESLPSLKGDFFVYSDIFTNGRPAYWSGYFTTRPYFKWLSRHLECTLNSAEFLYAWAWGMFSNSHFKRVVHVLQKDYEKLVKARRHLSLFQHHDAITGTSKSRVMHDYGIKLHQGIVDSLSVFSHSALALLATDASLVHLRHDNAGFDYLLPSFQQNSYDRLPELVPITFETPLRVVVLTNPLSHRKYEVIRLSVSSLNIRVTDEHGHDVPFQLNPAWTNLQEKMSVRPSKFELIFIADLPPLSMVTYTIHKTSAPASKRFLSVIYSNIESYITEAKESKMPFEFRNVQPGDIQFENDVLKLLFDGNQGLLRTATNKRTGKVTQFMMKYGAYPSAQFQSGAYIFKPDPNRRESEEDVLTGAKVRIFIHSGHIFSELTVMFGFVLMHSFKLFHLDHEPLKSSIYMENSFNLGAEYNKQETPGFSTHFKATELFFRFQTDINNGQNALFYTDQNGVGMQERALVNSIGIEGNYYPISTATYLEDQESEPSRRRVTVLVDRAAGVASLKPGYLEVMVERRMLYDDGRGMGEGVTDQKRTIGKYWLLLEDISGTENVPRLSLAAHHLSNALNNPVIPLILEGLESDSIKSTAHFINRPFPCSLRLLAIRTLAQPNISEEAPINKVLMVIQHQSPSCLVSSSVESCRGFESTLIPETNFTFPVSEIRETSLSGIHNKRRLESLSELIVPHHRLRTFVVSFG